jgi:hypothetical protein
VTASSSQLSSKSLKELSKFHQDSEEQYPQGARNTMLTRFLTVDPINDPLVTLARSAIRDGSVKAGDVAGMTGRSK